MLAFVSWHVLYGYDPDVGEVSHMSMLEKGLRHISQDMGHLTE